MKFQITSIACFFMGHKNIETKKCSRCGQEFGMPKFRNPPPPPPKMPLRNYEPKTLCFDDIDTNIKASSYFPETIKLAAENQIKEELRYPDFQEILESKREYYGETEAAIEFASEEFNRRSIKYCLRQISKESVIIIDGRMMSAAELIMAVSKHQC